jgi:hypothetical protein
MSRNKDVPTGTKLGDLKRIGGFDLGIYYIESESHKWEDNLDTFERAMKAMQDTYNRLKKEQAKKEILRKAENTVVESLGDIITNEPRSISDLSENQLLDLREMIDAVLMEEYSLEVDDDPQFHVGLPVADWNLLLDIESMTVDEMKAIVFDVGAGVGIDYKAICRLIKEAV